MKKISTTHISKLNGENYPQWKLQVSLVLKAYKVWGHVDGTNAQPSDAATAADKTKWNDADVEAMAIMVPLVDTKQMTHIRSCTTAKEVWDKLEKINSDASELNIQQTFSKFFQYKIGPEQSIVEAFGEIEELSRCLEEMNSALPEKAVVI